MKTLEIDPKTRAWIWTPEADAWIIECARQGVPAKEAAEKLSVSDNAVRKRHLSITGASYVTESWWPTKKDSVWPKGAKFEDVPDAVLDAEIKRQRRDYPPIGPLKSIKGAQRGAAV